MTLTSKGSPAIPVSSARPTTLDEPKGASNARGIPASVPAASISTPKTSFWAARHGLRQFVDGVQHWDIKRGRHVPSNTKAIDRNARHPRFSRFHIRRDCCSRKFSRREGPPFQCLPDGERLLNQVAAIQADTGDVRLAADFPHQADDVLDSIFHAKGIDQQNRPWIRAHKLPERRQFIGESQNVAVRHCAGNWIPQT